ncbi:hypothetical protein [Streptomyces sp. XD-27]|uniref:hypothetical protein n=1 Tax=Streptomyces sp. XD-27 TaxID=3062779 RepID=UPI0026F40C59|nr:hypothetical protein [Streptomyces sp. XD-27]WKX68635.1 hypothetical protein Q3Y56_00540 [Streptomyces sp. XD-27]
MKSVARTVRIVVTDHARPSLFPDHPSSYGITDPDEVRDLVAAVARVPPPAEDFVCMCQEEPKLMLYDAAGQRIGGFNGHWPELLDPAIPGSVPGRHRAAWAAAAPEALRAYAEGWARGETVRPGTAPPVPLSIVFCWLGTPPAGGDAARLLARRAPLALLEAATTDELAWAVRETNATGLDGAVDFFSSEAFTARHPKKRRVGATARDLLLRHARTRRPEHLAVLERRVLRAVEDRISR